MKTRGSCGPVLAQAREGDSPWRLERRALDRVANDFSSTLVAVCVLPFLCILPSSFSSHRYHHQHRNYHLPSIASSAVILHSILTATSCSLPLPCLHLATTML